ncbi:hypothetical protein RYX36_031182 [Vicia faba]
MTDQKGSNILVSSTSSSSQSEGENGWTQELLDSLMDHLNAHVKEEPRDVDEPHIDEDPHHVDDPHVEEEPFGVDEPHAEEEPAGVDAPHAEEQPYGDDEPHAQEDPAGVVEPHAFDDPLREGEGFYYKSILDPLLKGILISYKAIDFLVKQLIPGNMHV